MPQRGDPLAISARDWTEMQRVVEKFRNGGVSFQAPAQQSSLRSPTIVKVLNETGDPLDQCAIVGLGQPVILPADNEMEFIRNIAFEIVPPTPGRWGVLQSPVAAGEITTAIVAGVVACKINVISALKPNLFADAVAPDFAELQVSDVGGNAQILWRAGGTGTQWAIVRIGNTTCSERLEKFVMLSDWSDDGFAVARFTRIEESVADVVGIVEDPLGIFADQIGFGNSGLATRTCSSNPSSSSSKPSSSVPSSSAPSSSVPSSSAPSSSIPSSSSSSVAPGNCCNAATPVFSPGTPVGVGILAICTNPDFTECECQYVSDGVQWVLVSSTCA